MKPYVLILIFLLPCMAAPFARGASDPVNDLFQEAQKARNERRYDDALHIYERISTEYPERANDARSGIVDTFLGKAQVAKDERRFDDALHIYESITTEHPERRDAQGGVVDMLSVKAQAANNERKFDDALHLYERIITEHPEISDRWYGVERSIVDALIKKGDLAEAVKAAHLCLDSAPDLPAYNDTVVLAANILSALDKSVDRANQFLAFQQSGPAGGGANPMDAVGYPSQPDREKTFDAMRKQAGDGAASSELRARTFLLTGKPKEALVQFADAFRRSSSISDLQRASLDLPTVGLRDVRGHVIGIDKAIQFVIFGPNGPDGKPNTPDDLADPFKEWLPVLPASGEGGLAGLSAEDLTALRRVRDGAKLYARDPWVRGYIRQHALSALQRMNEALDGWGEPGLKEWYLQIALAKGAEDNDIAELSLVGAQAAARGTALHLGGVNAFWQEIDAWRTAQGVKSTKRMEHIEASFNNVCATLNKIQFQKPAATMLKTPATF